MSILRGHGKRLLHKVEAVLANVVITPCEWRSSLQLVIVHAGGDYSETPVYVILETYNPSETLKLEGTRRRT